MIVELALSIASVSGPQGRLTVSWTGRDGDRQQYRYVVEAADGEVLTEGEDLRSGTGEGVDHGDMLRSLVAFLIADAENYARHEMAGRGEQPTDGYLFNLTTAEWAYQVKEELDLAGEELDRRS